MRRWAKRLFGRNETGTALVLYALLLPGMVGMAGMAVDVGYLYTGRGELRNAVDAAALAGAAGLPTTATAQSLAIQFAQANQVFQQSLTLNASEIEFGTYDSSTRIFTVSATGINALRVTKQLAMPLFFAPIVGISTANLSAQSIGVMDPNITCGAIFANSELEFKGASVTDSYNSSQGAYNPGTAGSNGTVCSNGQIDLTGAVTVKGSATPGVGQTVDMGPNSTVTGSTTAATTAYTAPTIDVGDAATVNDNGSIGLTSRGNNPIGNGDPDFSLSGNETITLNSGTYYFNDLRITGNAALFINPGAGPVTIYVTGELNVGGTGIVNQNALPTDLRILVTGLDVDYSGTADFYGLIVAPGADLDISGTADFYGALIADEVDVKGTNNIHYDEALETTSVSGVATTTTGFLGG